MRYELTKNEMTVYFTKAEVNAVLRQVNGIPTELEEADLDEVFDWSVTDLVYGVIDDHLQKAKRGDFDLRFPAFEGTVSIARGIR